MSTRYRHHKSKLARAAFMKEEALQAEVFAYAQECELARLTALLGKADQLANLPDSISEEQVELQTEAASKARAEADRKARIAGLTTEEITDALRRWHAGDEQSWQARCEQALLRAEAAHELAGIEDRKVKAEAVKAHRIVLAACNELLATLEQRVKAADNVTPIKRKAGRK